MSRIIIIGGGPAGYSAAIRASQLNHKVILIEKDTLGGTCLNRGCIPTKALLHSSNLFAQIKSSDFLSFACNPEANIDKIYKRSWKIVQKFNMGIQSLIKSNSITYYNNTAKIKNNTTIELDSGKVLEGDEIILATGASPAVPPIKGIELCLTSNEIILQKFAKHKNIAIIGAGVVGMEFASFFSDLGSEVTVIDVLKQPLATMSEGVAKYISLALRRKKVKFALGAKVESITKLEDGFSVQYLSRNKSKEAHADIVISSVGRNPNTIEGLENTNIIFDKGFLVNEYGQTAEKNIYAVGDCVKGNMQLAHYASADGMRVIAGLSNKMIMPLKNVPSCIYTTPNAAVVGEVMHHNFQVEIGNFNIGANGKSLAEGGALGYIKVFFDKTNKRLIGAEMVCNNACELVGFISNMINKGMTRDDILSSVYPHPSISEAFYEAVEDSRKMSIHCIYK